MKHWNDFLARIQRALVEFEHGLLWGVQEQFEDGGEAPSSRIDRFIMVAFVVALVLWVFAYLAAGNAGYLE